MRDAALGSGDDEQVLLERLESVEWVNGSSEGDGEYADTGGMTNTGRRAGKAVGGSSFSAAASASECISIECKFKMISRNPAAYISQQVNSKMRTQGGEKFLKEIMKDPSPSGMSRSEVKNAAVKLMNRKKSLDNKLGQIQKRINKARKDNGKKPIDFNRMKLKMADELLIQSLILKIPKSPQLWLKEEKLRLSAVLARILKLPGSQKFLNLIIILATLERGLLRGSRGGRNCHSG